MQIRDFKTAAVNFFEAISTFTSTELMTYKTFVKYAALCCTVALPRSDLKSKVCLLLVILIAVLMFIYQTPNPSRFLCEYMCTSAIACEPTRKHTTALLIMC